jgi:hypothetical protein
MLRLLADENLDGALWRALRRTHPALDVLRVQDVGLQGESDEAVLAWAAENSRLVLTHDLRTMPRHAFERVDAGLPMPGVVAIPHDLPLVTALQDIALIGLASHEDEWCDRVLYLPLRS